MASGTENTAALRRTPQYPSQHRKNDQSSDLTGPNLGDCFRMEVLPALSDPAEAVAKFQLDHNRLSEKKSMSGRNMVAMSE